MSDYMFMLESHLSPDQKRVVEEVQEAATHANLNLFLTGGAMRDMLGGYPVCDLDFTVEGSALRLAKTLAKRPGARLLSVDDERKAVELRFPRDVKSEIAIARTVQWSRKTSRMKYSPASIQEDLRTRDFTVNCMALSLNRASLGLLLDPTNGQADLERRELRAVHGRVFYEDPMRLYRAIRLQVRLGFTMEGRTRQQYENAREAGVDSAISSRQLGEELRQITDEPNPGETLRVLESEDLLSRFSPALTGPKLNLPVFAKLQKARQLIPFGVEFPVDNLGLVLHVLTEKLTPKEKTALIKATSIRKVEVQRWQELPKRAKKAERELKSAKIKKPSQVYEILSKTPGEEVLFLLVHSPERLVRDRIKHYLQKYLLAVQEIADEEVAESGLKPGTAKFKKQKEEMIAARLDSRAKKASPAELPPEEHVRVAGAYRR